MLKVRTDGETARRTHAMAAGAPGEVIIRADGSYHGKEGMTLAADVSSRSAGARAPRLRLVTIPLDGQRIQEPLDDKRRLGAAIDDEHERLNREIEEITQQRELARERAIKAERRCEMLENLLADLDVDPDADNEGKFSPFPVHDPGAVAAHLRKFRNEGQRGQAAALAEKAAVHAPVSDVRQLVELLSAMREAGAIDQASKLARRAFASGWLSLNELKRLEPEALVSLLRNLYTVGASDLVREIADDAASCAWRGTKEDVENMISVLTSAGREDQADKLSREAWQMQVTSQRFSKV